MSLQYMSLGEVTTVIMGISPNGISYNNEGRGLPLLNGPTEFGSTYPNSTLFTTESKRECMKGDLIFCVRGNTTGRMNWADRVYSLGRGVCSIRGKSIVETRYIRYCLEAYLQELLQTAGGSTMPNLTQASINDFRIPYHGDRVKIATILSAYDDLIENNLRRIKILEQMAKTIYDEWFVKFHFPGHEIVKMVESELGLIPEGWEVCKLEEFIEIDRGISYSGKGLTPDGKPMVNLKNILPNGGFRRNATKPYSGDYKKQHVLKTGDIVLANTDLTQAGNVVGSPAIIPTIENCTDILFSHHIYAVRFKDEGLLPRLFAYHILLSPDFKAFAKGYASGTTVLGLPKEGVLDYVFVKPTTELMRRFADCANPLFAMMENCYQRNSNLTATRDLLLPKLISGEIDVENLDIKIEE